MKFYYRRIKFKHEKLINTLLMEHSFNQNNEEFPSFNSLTMSDIDLDKISQYYSNIKVELNEITINYNNGKYPLDNAKNDLQRICNYMGWQFPLYSNNFIGGTAHKPIWKSQLTIITITNTVVSTITGYSDNKRNADKHAAIKGLIELNLWFQTSEFLNNVIMDNPTMFNTTLPAVQLPAVQLPAVQLPAVQLPVNSQLLSLQQLPSLQQFISNTFVNTSIPNASTVNTQVITPVNDYSYLKIGDNDKINEGIKILMNAPTIIPTVNLLENLGFILKSTPALNQ